MGWKPEEGYYQKHVKEEGYSNKITDEQEKFNKLGPDEVEKGMRIAVGQIEKEMEQQRAKDVEKVMSENDREKSKDDDLGIDL